LFYNESYDWASLTHGAKTWGGDNSSKLVDDDENITEYASCTIPCNFTIQLKDHVYLRKIEIFFRNDSPKNFTYLIQVSNDNVTWNELLKANGSGKISHTINWTVGKYIKIIGLNDSIPNLEIVEIRINGPQADVMYEYSPDNSNWTIAPFKNLSIFDYGHTKIKFRVILRKWSAEVYNITCFFRGELQPPSCYDGIKNQDETDVDCGGAICPKCPVGKACLVDSDCITNYCVNGTCKERPSPPSPKGGGGGGGGAARKIEKAEEEEKEAEVEEEKIEHLGPLDKLIGTSKRIESNKTIVINFDDQDYTLEVQIINRTLTLSYAGRIFKGKENQTIEIDFNQDGKIDALLEISKIEKNIALITFAKMEEKAPPPKIEKKVIEERPQKIALAAIFPLLYFLALASIGTGFYIMYLNTPTGLRNAISNAGLKTIRIKEKITKLMKEIERKKRAKEELRVKYSESRQRREKQLQELSELSNKSKLIEEKKTSLKRKIRECDSCIKALTTEISLLKKREKIPTIALKRLKDKLKNSNRIRTNALRKLKELNKESAKTDLQIEYLKQDYSQTEDLLKREDEALSKFSSKIMKLENKIRDYQNKLKKLDVKIERLKSKLNG
ncbi:MAG: hypothetical protein ACTSYB_04485, partial [Candidatus Helarchaeota archaeon]